MLFSSFSFVLTAVPTALANNPKRLAPSLFYYVLVQLVSVPPPPEVCIWAAYVCVWNVMVQSVIMRVFIRQSVITLNIPLLGLYVRLVVGTTLDTCGDTFE